MSDTVKAVNAESNTNEPAQPAQNALPVEKPATESGAVAEQVQQLNQNVDQAQATTESTQVATEEAPTHESHTLLWTGGVAAVLIVGLLLWKKSHKCTAK